MASTHSIPESIQVEITTIMSEKLSAEPTRIEAWTDATISNKGPTLLTLKKNKDISGNTVGHLPKEIEVGETQGFEHHAISSSDPDGSIGYILYSGKNYQGDGAVDCAWFMAWSNPIATRDIKVIVDAGLPGKFNSDTLAPDAIKKRLEEGSTTSYCKDDGTGVWAAAEIKDASKSAKVVAVFSVAR